MPGALGPVTRDKQEKRRRQRNSQRRDGEMQRRAEGLSARLCSSAPLRWLFLLQRAESRLSHGYEGLLAKPLALRQGAKIWRQKLTCRRGPLAPLRLGGFLSSAKNRGRSYAERRVSSRNRQRAALDL